MNDSIIREQIILSSNTWFHLGRSEFLYVEPCWDERINAFFQKYADDEGRTGELMRRIEYLPSIWSNIEDIVRYNRPGMNMCDVWKVQGDSTVIQKLYNEIFSYREDIVNWKPTQPMLMQYVSPGKEGKIFSYYPLHYEDEAQFEEQLETIIVTYTPKIMGSCITDVTARAIRHERKEEIFAITEEIRERISKLKLMGMSDYVIRRLIELPEPKLSSLQITRDFRILLPDYGGIEIKIPTLSKVVFFFYLCHPEGVSFKDLIDHKQELLFIYYRLSNRENIDKLEKSINELIDPTSNSINEKCSRLRSAFVNRFDDELAKHYYVTGYVGGLKSIKLDRSLVKDESGIYSPLEFISNFF